VPKSPAGGNCSFWVRRVAVPAAFQSGRGLPQSTTLARLLTRWVMTARFWTAEALCRFGNKTGEPDGCRIQQQAGIAVFWDAEGLVTLHSKAVGDSHPYPHFLVLYFRGGFALACGVNGGVVGPARVCRWRCLRLAGAGAVVSLLNQVRAWSILKPSPNVCAPGGPSPVRAMNPPSIATRMLACCTVSRLLAGYFPVSFF